MNTKSLSSRQVRWAQELSQYHFQIDYCQGKANAVADALSCFPQRSQAEEETLRDESSQILHRLQTSLTRAKIAGLSLLGHQTADFLLIYQILICETHVLLRLCQFLTQPQGELVYERSYQASIGGLRLRLSKLQTEDQEAQRVRE